MPASAFAAVPRTAGFCCQNASSGADGFLLPSLRPEQRGSLLSKPVGLLSVSLQVCGTGEQLQSFRIIRSLLERGFKILLSRSDFVESEVNFSPSGEDDVIARQCLHSRVGQRQSLSITLGQL